MSRSVHLLLPRQFYGAILKQARTELPNECCGLLAGVREGDVLRVEKVYPLVNEAASPVEYQSEPRSMFAADKDMRALGIEILATYHSHPSGEPVPSKTDLERSYGSDVIHFIIGLKSEPPSLRGWWLTETSFSEAAWEILEP